MKKITLFMLFFLAFAHASELIKIETFKEAQALAQKENKHIMLFLTSPTCYYCKQMKSRTLKIPKVIDRINERYFFVELDENSGVYPEDIVVSGVPATIFLYNDGTKIMRPVMGYWSSVDFLSFMDDATRAIAKKKKEDK